MKTLRLCMPAWMTVALFCLLNPYSVRAEHTNTSLASNLLERLGSDDPMLQLNAMLDPGLNLSALSDEGASQLAARLLEIAKTNYVGTKSPHASEDRPAKLSSSLVGMAILHLDSLGPRANSALPFLSGIVVDTNANEIIRLSSFNAISRISPNSETDTKVVAACLQSTSDRLFEAGVNRLYNEPRYLAASNFIPILVGSMRRALHTNEWRTIRALGHIEPASDHAIQTIRSELDSTNAANRAEAVTALFNVRAMTTNDIVKIGGFLFNKDDRVRANAVAVLQGLGTNALPARPSLQQAANAGDSQLSNAAKRILGQLESLQRRHDVGGTQK